MGTAIFDSQAGTVVLEALARIRQKVEAERTFRVERIQNFYANNVQQYLLRYEAEDTKSYQIRLQRMAVPNYIARIADTLIDGVYADPIEMTIEDDDESKANEAIQRILDWNKFGQVQRDVGYGQVVCGDVWIGVQYIDEPENGLTGIGLPIVWGLNVAASYHPSNPKLLVFAEERRAHPTEQGKYIYWRWTPQWYEVVDEKGDYLELTVNGRAIRGRQAHGYGIIPLVRVPGRQIGQCDYGYSYIEDGVDLQQMLLQWVNELDQLTYLQIHSLLFTSGMTKAEIVLGPNRHLNSERSGSTAEFLAPNASHADVRENIRLLVEMLSDTQAVPLSTIRGGGMASSGYQAELEMAPTARVVDAIRDDAIDSFKDLLRAIVAVGSYHKVEGLAGLSQEKINPVVKITASILPRDEATERAKDLTEVESGMRTRKDYVRAWVLPQGTDPAEVDAYLVELDAQAQAKQDALAAEFDAKFRAPGVPGTEIGPTPDPSAPALPGEDVAKTALNGAQVTALQGMLAAVADGTLMPEAAIIAIGEAFPTIAEERVRAMVEAQQEAEPPAPPPSPFAPPAAPETEPEEEPEDDEEDAE